jgi:drug/metabolite transporter (DMT)-like permease
VDALSTFALTVATMIAFGGNSLLCRAALHGGAIDATSFTAIRLASATLVVVAIARVRRRGDPDPGGSWSAALVLAGYAIAFSLAYLRLDAGIGALLQFGSAQLTMIAGGLVHGERPSPRQWVGLAVAAAGMVVINLPGLEAPPPGGAALMLAAGVGWGLYSLSGRGARRPIRATAGNFVRCLPFTAAFGAIAIAGAGQVTARGAVLAAVSGALTTGLGYCVWYAVLPSLGAARGAIVQLSVPVFAAAGAIVLLDEPLQRPVAIGGAIILGGLALALWQRRLLPAAAVRRSGPPRA